MHPLEKLYACSLKTLLQLHSLRECPLSKLKTVHYTDLVLRACLPSSKPVYGVKVYMDQGVASICTLRNTWLFNLALIEPTHNLYGWPEAYLNLFRPPIRRIAYRVSLGLETTLFGLVSLAVIVYSFHTNAFNLFSSNANNVLQWISGPNIPQPSH